MFDAYPKKRPQVDLEKLNKLLANYEANRLRKTAASKLSGFMEGWMHFKVAEDVKSDNTKATLEIGAGNLNHLSFEQPKVYDIVEPWKKLWEHSPALSRVRSVYNDISEILPGVSYDRIISIATFEHLTHLPQVVAMAVLLLNETGCMRVGIPNEGSFIWKTCWRLTTGLEYFIKTGNDYGLIMKYEHVNTANEIEEVLRYFFSDVRKKVLGINSTFSIYHYYECYVPEKTKAQNYLHQTNS
jgi:hypothetical protein